jgi:tetratricopeptide (TPR) repeat protein
MAMLPMTMTLIAWLILLIPALAVVGLLNQLVHQWYFTALPKRAIKKYEWNDPDRLLRYLERVVATPSFAGASHKLTARSLLSVYYHQRGRYAEAVAQCRANLAGLARVRPLAEINALEAQIRRTLADSLEALGEVDEAGEQRRRSEALLDRSLDGFMRYLEQGTHLEREYRYAEACAAYEHALPLLPRSDGKLRATCLNKLGMACWNAGRPAECLEHAEQSLSLGPEGQSLKNAHRIAALACAELGRLDKAEEHFRRAYEMAAAVSNQAEIGQLLSSLAAIQLRRGKLAEAERACSQIDSKDPIAARTAITVRAQVLKHRGRFDEAMALLVQAQEVGTLTNPEQRRRVDASQALITARVAAECGRADEAWELVQEAVSELGSDAKFGLLCDSAAAWILAVRGLPDDSRRISDQVETRLHEFTQDPTSTAKVLFDLGMAAGTRGDHSQAEAFWSRLLDLATDPIVRPVAFYRRGECWRQRGDVSKARADFRAAVATEIDIHYAQLAARRLKELPPA